MNAIAEGNKENSSLEHIEITSLSSNYALYSNTKIIENISELLKFEIDKIEDIAVFTPSVFANTAIAGMQTGISIRGFSLGNKNIYVNGHLDNQRMFIRSPETIEQVTIEKGHSSIYYGGAAPGGTLIYKTKTPQPNQKNTLKLTMGSHNKYKLSADNSGIITNKIEYRTVLVKQKSDSYIQNARDDKETFYNHISWSISDNQHLGFEFEYNQLTNPWTFGIVRIDDKILYDKSYVYPSTQSDRRYYRTSFYWDYLYNTDLKISAKFNHVDVKRDDTWMGFYYKLANDQLLGYWADIENKADQNNVRIELEKRVNLGSTIHNFRLGFNYNDYQNSQYMDRSIGEFLINPHIPDYSIPKPKNINSIKKFSSNEIEKSFYLLDNIVLNNTLNISIGSRYSEFKIFDIINNAVAVDNSALTTFVGASYKLSNYIDLYSNISKSFEPNIGLDKNLNYFEPKEATQYEASTKVTLNPLNEFIFSLYNIEQSNLLTRDPTDPDFKILAGRMKSKGIELSFNTYINDEWKLTSSISHMKDKLKDKFSNNNGNTSSNIPSNSFSSILSWNEDSNKMGANIRLLSRSSRYGNNANSFKLSGYTRIDLSGYLFLQKWKLQLDIENLLNKKYITTSNYEDDMYQGRTRDIKLSLTYAW